MDCILTYEEEVEDFEDALARVFKDVTGEVFDIDYIEHYKWNMYSKAHIFTYMLRYGLNWHDALDEYVQREKAKYVWETITESEE